jgi:hypothetical protein
MADLTEKHVRMQFCFKLGEHTMEDFDMLKIAFVEHRWGLTEASDRLSGFRSIVTSVEDAKCLVHLSASKTDENVGGMKELVLKNSSLSLQSC